MEKKIAVFPGSFDPITVGHESVILRAMPLFDEIHVAIGLNSLKSSMFSVEKRLEWLRIVFEEYPQIKVESYSGLTVDYCLQIGAAYLLRGLRTSADFEFERSIGQVNKHICPEIETIFMLTDVRHTPVNSSIVRDIINNQGDISGLIPKKIVGLVK